MFSLNCNKSGFQERSKSVFDTLSTLESSHRNKANEYIDKNLDNLDSTLFSSPIILSGLSKSSTNDFEFKVPTTPSTNNNSNKRPYRSNTPDYLVNPKKWKRYSLEDVKESEMSAAGNRMAAMSFLNRNETSNKCDVNESDRLKIEFNRPIGNKKKNKIPKIGELSLKSRVILEENNEDEDMDMVSCAKVDDNGCKSSDFRKKKSKRNLRKKEDPVDVEEEKEPTSRSNNPAEAVISNDVDEVFCNFREEQIDNDDESAADFDYKY